MARRTLTVLANCSLAALALVLANTAMAQAECGGGACGTPYESGGSNPCVEGGDCICNGGVCVAGSILIANTDMGDTYQYADDFDVDGWEDDYDNCPFAVNAAQEDSDGDGFGDACDNCPSHSNPDQADANGNFVGNACDDDADGDGVSNQMDNCWLQPNPGQLDTSGNGLGNACDDDDDADGLPDVTDPCPLLAGVTDGSDDRCDMDSDNDGIPDSIDLCAMTAAEDNRDSDLDGIGDACDLDLDNDGVPNTIDNCRLTANTNQLNADRDGLGDACDSSFCFVVDSADGGRCLNPASRFQGRPGPDMTILTGERIRLRMFTNRPNAPTRYAWKVTRRPAGADAEIENSNGTVNFSSPWEFHYQKERVASFVARTPGEYEVELQTNLVFDDEMYPSLTSDKQTMTIVVTGEALGCSALTASGSSAGLLVLLGLALVGLRRRG
ncbi:MAG: thrombospondin type 3 repeat-containing protein [Pseudomonadota bacterium]